MTTVSSDLIKGVVNQLLKSSSVKPQLLHTVPPVNLTLTLEPTVLSNLSPAAIK